MQKKGAERDNLDLPLKSLVEKKAGEHNRHRSYIII